MAACGADFSALVRAEPSTVSPLLGLVLVNVLLTAVVFWLVTLPVTHEEQPVRLRDMVALIAAGSLLNYLPLRPGLIGRAAYLKFRHGIGYRASLTTLALVMVGSVLVYGLVLISTLSLELNTRGWWLALAAGSAAIALAAGPALAFIGRRVTTGLNADSLDRFAGMRAFIPLLLWLIVRLIDLLAVAGRLYLAFHLVGRPIWMSEAVILASAGMFITLISPFPNGLGIREWLYGLIAAKGFFDGDVEGGLQLALTAALVDRAAEVLIIAPTGLIALGYVRKRMLTTSIADIADAAETDTRQD